MRTPVRQAAALASLLAFGTLAPRVAIAQPDGPRPSQPTTVQPPPPGQPAPQQPVYYPPPGYQQPPPGYQQPPPGYQPGYQQPPPGGYYQQQQWQAPQYRTRYEEQRRWGLFVGGAAIFGGIWLFSGMVGYINGTAYGFIPVVGPLFYIKSENQGGYYDSSSIRADNALAVFATIAQGIGVTMGILGLVLTKKVAVRELVTVAPVPLPGGGGLTAMGRF